MSKMFKKGNKENNKKEKKHQKTLNMEPNISHYAVLLKDVVQSWEMCP